jgi:hypothetical protein
MSQWKVIECNDHGRAYTTYVCRHLMEGTNTHWYSAEVDDEHPWPDSWCGICNAFFEAEGEWNEKSESAAELGKNMRLICHHCYESIRSKCPTHTI